MAAVVIGCTFDDAEEKRAERPAATAGTIDVEFNKTSEDGTQSSVKISATDYNSDKEINFRWDANGNPVFSSQFKPKQSKEFYAALTKIIGTDAPENILGSIIREGVDGAGRQINPISPALQGLTADDFRALTAGLQRLREESQAQPINPQ